MIGDEKSPARSPAEIAFSYVELETLRNLGFSLCIKRAFDVILSAAALIFASPLWILIALVIKIESKGPVLYVAPRLGHRGRPFNCYKFRSMVMNADEEKERLRHLNYREGAFFKIENDPRVTTIGRFIRATSIDELPQLLNILRGEMSLVGPRPHPLDDCLKYTADDMRRLNVLPGLTGMWQVRGRKNPSFAKSIELDIEYIRNWSLWLDLKIILETIPAVFSRAGE